MPHLTCTRHCKPVVVHGVEREQPRRVLVLPDRVVHRDDQSLCDADTVKVLDDVDGLTPGEVRRAVVTVGMEQCHMAHLDAWGDDLARYDGP